MTIEDVIKEMIEKEVRHQLADLVADTQKRKIKADASADAPVLEKPRRGRRPNSERIPGAPVRKPVKIITEAARKAISTFAIGEVICYKQGKGTFEAKITGIDVNTCTIEFERAASGKYSAIKDARTADKIYKKGAVPNVQNATEAVAAAPAPVESDKVVPPQA